jgi:catechol 2,3-dioxygenase-like lactoylglutathione lyase family enzyme
MHISRFWVGAFVLLTGNVALSETRDLVRVDRLPPAHRRSFAAPWSEPVLTTASGAFWALSVADIAASTKWYSEKLGLRVTMQMPKQGTVAVAVLGGGGLTVELIQHDEAMPLGRAAPAVKDPQFVHGVFKVGVVVDDYDATLAALRARGVEIAYGPFPARAGQRANVIVRDNAGTLIQFFGK